MLTLNDRLPGYILHEELMRTDRAIVYRGVDDTRDRPVAVKLVQNDGYGKHEITMLRRVQRANPAGPAHVMRLLHTHEDGDDLWLVLELFNATLSQMASRKLTPLALMSIAVDSAKGLVEMQRAGIVDDDVKPENVALKAASGRVAHIDLGCARLRREKPKGYTPDYAAPEIQCGTPSDTSPCYGWGRTIEFLAAGRIGMAPDTLLTSCVPWIAEPFARLVARCCESDPDKRPSVDKLYRTVKQLVQERRRCSCCNAVMFRDGICPNCGR